MLPEKLRSIFRKESDFVSTAKAPFSSFGRTAARKEIKLNPPVTRQSRGLEQFFFEIRDVVGLSILDLAGATQENINYLTSLGHKIYSQDIVRSLDEAFGSDPADQTNPALIESFLRSNLDYPAGTFDGVLLWDSLQFMGPALLNATVERLADVMRPKSYLLAFFTANDKVAEVMSYAFRIVDQKTILLAERGIRPSGQVFNNRNLEKLFGKFECVKFFLTRESLREVIVRR
ncbi:MAG TPA: class I SAM-dependent methyltransferase [Bryobacteraceae bacterium]|nr:class I SAM-dependent methyltransferase [Bryobacteraceae bacterium]